MTLDPPTRRRGQGRNADSGGVGAAQRLRATFAAVRVSFTWFGVRKSLSTEQRAQAAESFGAEGHYLSAAKKLLDTRDPKFRQVTSVRSRIVSYWKALSLPYPSRACG